MNAFSALFPNEQKFSFRNEKIFPHFIYSANLFPAHAGVILQKQASDLTAKKDPNHIKQRMKECGITDEPRDFMKESKAMFVQWGVRQIYFDKGAVVITKTDDGWVYRTAFMRADYKNEVLEILEVIHKYVR